MTQKRQVVETHPPRHLAHGLPLSGSRLIEASAGTGKTHALVLLILRALIVERLQPGEIVAVTFTRAAAGELRERVRDALSAALQRSAGGALAKPHRIEADLALMLAEARQRHPDETHAVQHRRLHAAVQGLDALWLSTIHGFCQRVLEDFGPALGEPVPLEIDDGAQVRRLACADAWRQLQGETFAVADDPCLATPAALEALLKPLLPLPAEALLPAPTTPARLERLRKTWAKAWRNAADASRDFDGLAAQIRDRATYAISVAKKDGLPDAMLPQLAEELRRFFDAPEARARLPDHLHRLSQENLHGLMSKPRRDKGVPPPDHPLAPALDELLAAEAALFGAERVQLIHRLYADVRARMDEAARLRGIVAFDQLVERLADVARDRGRGPKLRALAQSRWKLALIDEFQDTDAGQYALFAHLFGDRLVMVGDPKQAIYKFRGGDVYTYRRARDDSHGVSRLDTCHRAEAAVMSAVNALFDPARVPDPFLDGFIGYEAVQCGYDAARNGALVRAGKTLAGLHAWAVRTDESASWSNKDSACEQVESQVAGAIAALLDPADGARVRRATAQGEVEAALRAEDIAVLCQSHDQCASVAAALRRCGVPVQLAVDRSVEAAAAEDLRRLFAVWLAPHDARRLRALALSGFHGLTATQLPDDLLASPLPAASLDAIAGHAARAAQGDVGVALLAAVREGAANVRALPEGERRLGAWLALVDRILGWVGPGTGLDELHQRLCRWIDDSARERDDRRGGAGAGVQVMTIHASKGLEFGVVFAPYLWNGREFKAPAGTPVQFHDADGVLRADIGSDSRDAHVAIAAREESAEALRKTYVAVTRARHAIFLPVAVTRLGWRCSPLAHLLPGVDAGSGAGLAEALQALAAHARDAVTIDPPPRRERLPLLAAADTAPAAIIELPPARVASRFRLLSYSRLSRERIDRPQDHDQVVALADAAAEGAPLGAGSALRGAAFGSCFHALMETLDPAQPDADEFEAILRAHGYAERSGARELLWHMCRAVWSEPLPGGTCLRDAGAEDRVAEMEFFVPVRRFEPQQLARTLDAVPAYRRTGESWSSSLSGVHGYLRGFIDLLYRAGDRYFVLDYKTNDLGIDPANYRGDALLDAVREHDYDLQYLIYLVALQRLLRSRLGGAYDYEQHVGGAVYLFVRGLDGQGGGIHFDRPPAALVDALEAVLCGEAA
jgi:exodeoxyribonuclease V beta subunit